MNDLYEKAVRRLAAIREEERLLNEFIVSHRRALRMLGAPEQPTLFDAGPDRDPTPGTRERETEIEETPKRGRVTTNPKPSVVAENAVAILREKGAPMSRRALHGALAERGLNVQGSDPIKTLGTILWRNDDKLIQLDGFGYWPRGDRFDPADYVPDN